MKKWSISELTTLLHQSRGQAFHAQLLNLLKTDDRSGVQRLLHQEHRYLEAKKTEEEHIRKMYQIEESYLSQGYAIIAGLDEAGRGPLAGPVVAAAVILDELDIAVDFDDSKRLSAARREELADYIKENALSYAVALRSPAEIDEKNILTCSLEAMNEAVESLSLKPDILLIDGDHSLPQQKTKQVCYISGDSRIRVIAAASIMAKVYRDRLMQEYDRKYPLYRFASHKGYGTAEHIALLKKYGPCPIHRQSFLKNIL